MNLSNTRSFIRTTTNNRKVFPTKPPPKTPHAKERSLLPKPIETGNLRTTTTHCVLSRLLAAGPSCRSRTSPNSVRPPPVATHERSSAARSTRPLSRSRAVVAHTRPRRSSHPDPRHATRGIHTAPPATSCSRLASNPRGRPGISSYVPASPGLPAPGRRACLISSPSPPPAPCKCPPPPSWGQPAPPRAPLAAAGRARRAPWHVRAWRSGRASLATRSRAARS